MATQIALFNKEASDRTHLMKTRSGSFVDNLALPVHRWFRYSAGFAAQWVEEVLDYWGIDSKKVILDPFAGCGTVMVACDVKGVRSIGLEAHPVTARICRAKLFWPTPVDRFLLVADEVRKDSVHYRNEQCEYPSLIQRSFDPETLAVLHGYRRAWAAKDDGSPESELVWLAVTAILRPCSTAGTAQWQYILPNKKKKCVLSPDYAFTRQIALMSEDMKTMQGSGADSVSTIVKGDARSAATLVDTQIDAVITSPPYANNYDYADALRFEMTFWADVNSWGDIHEKVRKHLIVSSSQHSSRERYDAEELLELPEVSPIREELTEIVRKLAVVRGEHGGKKHYHTMVAAYLRDISRVLQQLSRLCNKGSHMCWVIGDSAPYGVYCPVDRWIGELAVAAGFQSYRFEKLRDRNIKWKNRKHRVPLKEGLLWIER